MGLTYVVLVLGGGGGLRSNELGADKKRGNEG